MPTSEFREILIDPGVAEKTLLCQPAPFLDARPIRYAGVLNDPVGQSSSGISAIFSVHRQTLG